MFRHLTRCLSLFLALLPMQSAANPVDYDGLVLGAELLEPPMEAGAETSGLLDLEPWPVHVIPDLRRAFPPEGLQIGDVARDLGERQNRMVYALAGTLVMAADDIFNTEEAWDHALGNPPVQGRERYFSGHDDQPGRPRGPVMRWQIFGSSSINRIGFPYDGINHWWLYPEVNENGVIRRGRLLLTWENIPSNSGNLEPRRNSYQMLITHVGDGNADIQLRYARCEWTSDRGDFQYVISGFHTGVVRDDIYYPGQTVYDPDSFTPRIKRRCAYSNSGETGVWEYALRNGEISGCGIADGPYEPSPDDQPGDDCDDNNNLPGDGCSPGCWVEGDEDEDGIPDAPPREPRTPEGLPVNPDGIYDNCVSRNPERDCGDLDADADNVLDRNDNCEGIPNPGQEDFNNDGVGDACETDDDADGIEDFEDLCPQAHSAGLHRTSDPNSIEETYRIQLDNDKDGHQFDGRGPTPGGDPCDPDDDNDGVLDCGDDGVCPYFDDGSATLVRDRIDESGEGIPYRDGIDNDLDGLIDEEQPDLMIWEGSGAVVNRLYDRFDNDEDGVIDEFDERGRGLPVPLWPGRDPGEDNCRTIPNPDQANLDGDIWGDACDKDTDGDYILDCGADGLCAYDRDQRDNDHDGTIDEAGECADGCDPADDLVDNDQDGYYDEEPFEFGASGESAKALGVIARQSSEALLAFRPWPGPDEGEDNCPQHRNVEQIDSDGDGIGDACDDDDGDGYFLAAQDPPIPALEGQHAVGQPADNCPDVANPDQADSDGDGQGDACEVDDDADGVPDDSDNCPTVPNPNQANFDDDRFGDLCDDDIDGDGFSNDEDWCDYERSTENLDSDGDERGDVCDDDDDNDGQLDVDDNCPLQPCDWDTLGEQCAIDSDNDGIGDACDNDRDGDGVDQLDADGARLDNCPDVPNGDQLNTDADARNGDALGDACDADIDADGVDNDDDNCPLDVNANQANLDNDMFGDECDDDIDGDGVPNHEDGCPLDAEFSVNTDGEDLGDDCGDMDDDNDGIDDVDDNCPLVASTDQSDPDGDGLGTPCDDDNDGDNVIDTADNCPAVMNGMQEDLDRDGIGDVCDDDIDGDSVPNAEDNCPRIINPDGEDLCFDGDGDGIPDTKDNCPKTQNFDQADFDNDGVGNLCDPDYRLNAEELAACRADHSPLQWALKCRVTKRVGCTAAPGEPGDWFWWCLPGLLLIRRLRH